MPNRVAEIGQMPVIPRFETNIPCFLIDMTMN